MKTKKALNRLYEPTEDTCLSKYYKKDFFDKVNITLEHEISKSKRQEKMKATPKHESQIGKNFASEIFAGSHLAAKRNGARKRVVECAVKCEIWNSNLNKHQINKKDFFDKYLSLII